MSILEITPTFQIYQNKRICKKCNEMKDLNVFQPNGNKKSNTFRHTCKVCYLLSIKTKNAISYQKRKKLTVNSSVSPDSVSSTSPV